MTTLATIIKNKPWIGWLLFCATALAVFLIGMFATTIMERRSEMALTFQIVKPISDWEPRNEVWGENFPREYESYSATRDTSFKSKYGGVSQTDYLQQDPSLVILWAGYAFAKDYRQARGHYHAITDIRRTLRTGQPQPATCWTCKSTDVPRLMNQFGVAEFYHKKWSDLGSEVVNHIGCQDCHDPKTMNLRITRPALIEAFARQGRDIRGASHQEMRSLVCAQCHVEYYFKGEGKYLTFPWDKGFSADDMENYYDGIAFKDWEHGLSKAPMLKCQHPDYETYLTGVHADRQVSCADCHMPYKSEGGVKFTDHKIQSPLNNIANSCQVCHRESEEKLRQNVYARQDKIQQLKGIVEAALVSAHFEAKAAWDKGASPADMQPVLTLIRHAQWRWDWVAAANGVGFHSPLEAARVLGTAIASAGEARRSLAIVLAKLNAGAVTIPAIASKEQAQAAINLDMQKFAREKEEFIKTVLPQWDKDKKHIKNP